MTACRYARVPSSRRITVVSMCQSSSGRPARTPSAGRLRMDTDAWPPPAMAPHEAVPRRRRRAHGAAPLREQRQPSGRHVPIGLRRDHVTNGLHLCVRQSLRRCARTRRPVPEGARVLPTSPRLHTPRRDPDEAQHTSQRHLRARLCDGEQHFGLGGAVRYTRAGEPEARRVAHRQRESKQCGELADAAPQDHDVAPEFSLIAHEIGESHDRCRSLPHPASRGRPRDTADGREPKVARLLDEVPEPVVVALLPASRGHAPS